MAASLMAALILGGNAAAQSGQQPDSSPSATQPSTTSPDNSSKPMSEEPNMSNPQATQDQQANPADNDQTREHDASKTNRDSTNVASDTTQHDVKAFDQFLHKHPQVAQDLGNDPSKINDTAFVSNHKELQHWLGKHPRVQDEIKENPAAFMHQENRYDKNVNKPQ
jgi:hypothetical protein